MQRQPTAVNSGAAGVADSYLDHLIGARVRPLIALSVMRRSTA